jgi:hypothetical protein
MTCGNVGSILDYSVDYLMAVFEDSLLSRSITYYKHFIDLQRKLLGVKNVETSNKSLA